MASWKSWAAATCAGSVSFASPLDHPRSALPGRRRSFRGAHSKVNTRWGAPGWAAGLERLAELSPLAPPAEAPVVAVRWPQRQALGNCRCRRRRARVASADAAARHLR